VDDEARVAHPLEVRAHPVGVHAEPLGQRLGAGRAAELRQQREKPPARGLGEDVVGLVAGREIDTGQFSHLDVRSPRFMVRCQRRATRTTVQSTAAMAARPRIGARSRNGAVASNGRKGIDARTVAAHEFFRRGEANAEGWSMLIAKSRGWESAYRDRWRHDKIVRSTHGVNCTGSCSWNVYVKDGLITWESQAVD
jgi:hypothetical protein